MPTSARCHAQPRFHAQCAVSLPNPHPQQEQRFSPVVMPHVCASTMRRQPALQQGIAPDPPRQCKDASTTPMIMCCVFAACLPPPPSPTHPVSPARNVREPGGRRASHSTEPSRAEHHHDRRGSRTRLQDSRPQIAGLIPPKWRSFAAVAQLAARRSHNPKVGSSILSCRILYLPTPRLGKGQPPPRTRIVFSP